MGGGNRGAREKPPICSKSLTMFFTKCCIYKTQHQHMLLWEADPRIRTYRWCNNYCADRAIDLGFDRLPDPTRL